MFDIVNRTRNKDFYDSFFNDFFSDAYEGKMMKVDIRDQEQVFILDAEIPGVRKEDIKILTNDDMLTINVKREEKSSSGNEKYLRKERKFGSFSRTFTIRDIDKENINARYTDGILTVTLPKLSGEEHVRTKIIKID